MDTSHFQVLSISSSELMASVNTQSTSLAPFYSNGPKTSTKSKKKRYKTKKVKKMTTLNTTTSQDQ